MGFYGILLFFEKGGVFFFHILLTNMEFSCYVTVFQEIDFNI